MCGIVGYIGNRDAVSVLVKGLEHLEYRGYDSAGIACLDSHDSGFYVRKEKGKLSALKSRLNDHPTQMHVGIGHTRWATHGEPSQTNAHPHLSQNEKIAVVHNGIIENYAELKSELQQKGYQFQSATDTEVVAHLIEDCYQGDPIASLREAAKKLEGFFALVVLFREDRKRLFILKRSNPIVIGLGQKEHFVASDVSALLPYTKKVIYLEDDELAELKRDSVEITNLKTGRHIKRHVSEIEWDVEEAKKGGFPHFMLKEIHEQPRALEEIISKRFDKQGNIFFDSLDRQFGQKLKKIKKVFLVSCGTAYHAGLVGNYMFGDCARLSTQAAVSSEFRYEDPVVGQDDLVILITQSGETADTLAAMREAKRKGALTLAVVNVVGSTIAREADAVIYTHAGPEIGVASTKAYTAQLMTLAFLAIYLGRLRETISDEKFAELVHEIKKIPHQCAEILKQEERIETVARKHYLRRNFLYLGRGYNFPNALEGALKLKEISYAHAHGYAAGEMKHGPIALVDSEQVVICIAPRSSKTYEKMISNIEEIRARQGIVIAIAAAGDQKLQGLADDILTVPDAPEMFSPLLTALPLQLFAYKIAVLNGRDVDQPRNLAKSVTVE